MTYAALAHKPEEKKKGHVAPEPAEAPELASETAAGAPAGAPLFLRLAGGTPPPLQRQAAPESLAPEEEEEREEEVLPVQGKLEVNAPGDSWEQEADRMAATVMRKEESASLPEPEEEERETIQRKPAGSGPVPSGLSVPVPDSGAPLSGAVRERIEPVLGADLGNIRVHTSPAARESARSLRAKAFTHRDHIWLGPGQSADNIELMAHEATHVLQQNAGPNGPKPIQRAPADYRHPEDGGGVLGRMQARMADELGEEEAAAATSRPAPAAGRPPTVAGPDPEAQRSAQQIDRGELAAQKDELTPEARPDVDRPAQEAPGIEASASATEEEAESPSEPLAEGEGGAAPGEGEGGEGEAEGAAAAAASLADQAFAMADSQPMPTGEAPVIPPQPAAPVDAGGKPLPADPETDAAIVDLATQAQSLRDGGLQMRQQAAEGRANAGILRGNLEIVRTGVQQAEESISTAEGQITARQEVVGQAREALAVSEQKAATVAADAPNFQSKADEGKADSGPMASESAGLAAENRANTPDDPEAAANAREQGGQMEKVGADAATMDGAISQTRDKAVGLTDEAARAQETNTATAGRLDEVDEQLGQTQERLGQMTSQTQQASAQAEAQAGAPDAVAAQAADLDQRGLALIQASVELEQRVRSAQTGYEQGMRTVPAQKPPPEAGQGGGGGPEGVIQRQPEDGEPPLPAPAPEPSAPEAAAPPEAAPPPDAMAPPEGGPAGPASAEAPPEAALPPGGAASAAPTGDRYEDREQVNLAESLPSWLTGAPDPGTEQEQQRQREEATQREQQRRADEVALINQWSGGRFEDLSAADKVGIALRLAGHSALGSISRIQWPGWAGAGRFALKALDPRTTLSGVTSGLSMMLSGGANLLSGEQWRRDPLGNLLKSAADIATGLTIVLGSITALAGLIIAIMTAISILSFGTAAPITGPVIAFCATVMTTVGGWTIAVGKVALVLQALVLIKNLIDAATAQTAEDLQSQSDQIRSDVGNMATVALTIAGARAAQMGGRQLTSRIQTAGGATAFARGAPARFAGGVSRTAGAVGRVASGTGRAIVSGAQSVGRGIAGAGRWFMGGARSIGRGIAGGLRGPGSLLSRGWRGVRSLFGRNRGPINAAIGSGDLRGRIADAFRTFRLRRLRTQVVREVDDAIARGDLNALRALGASQREATRVLMGGSQAAKFRGTIIDTAAKTRASQMFGLRSLTSARRFQYGPDFWNPRTMRAWDLTTAAEWQAHVRKYITNPAPGRPVWRSLEPLLTD